MEQPRAAAKPGPARRKWRQRKARARRNVVRIGSDGLQELQIVPAPTVGSQPGAQLPLILCKEPDVRVSLWEYGIAKRLGIRRRIVSSLEEVRQGRERVTATYGSRERNGYVIVEKIRANSKRVRAHLVGEAIGNLVQVVHASGG